MTSTRFLVMSEEEAVREAEGQLRRDHSLIGKTHSPRFKPPAVAALAGMALLMFSRGAGPFALAGSVLLVMAASWGGWIFVSLDAQRVPPGALREKAETLRGHLQGECPKCRVRVIFNPPAEASWEATCPACRTSLRFEGETAFVK